MPSVDSRNRVKGVVTGPERPDRRELFPVVDACRDYPYHL